MKKTLVALTLATASGAASADFIGAYVGGGVWNPSYSGDAGADSVSMSELNLEDTNNLFIYAGIEHFLPLIPNIRLGHTQVQVDGEATLSSQFRLNNRTFEGNTDVYTDMDLTHTDATLYYELLDNWVSLDVGLTARYFDGYVYVEDRDEPSRNERADFSLLVPLLYARTQFELPLTGWRVGASGNVISYDGDSYSDLEASLGYEFSAVLLKFAVDLGYRRMHLDVSGQDDLHADITIAGPYLRTTLRF